MYILSSFVICLCSDIADMLFSEPFVILFYPQPLSKVEIITKFDGCRIYPKNFIKSVRFSITILLYIYVL